MATRVPFSMQIDMDSADMIKEILNDAVDEFLDDVRDEVEDAWKRRASNSTQLNTTKQRYIDAIGVIRAGDEIICYLNDELAANLESGSDPYDLKPGFLRGKTHRVIPLVESSSPQVRFRTVSAKSAPWIHPGHHPRDIVGQVNEEVKTDIMGEVFSRIMSRISV